MGISLQQPANLTHNIFISSFPLPGRNLFVLNSLSHVQTAGTHSTCCSWGKCGVWLFVFFFLGFTLVGVFLSSNP